MGCALGHVDNGPSPACGRVVEPGALGGPGEGGENMLGMYRNRVKSKPSNPRISFQRVVQLVSAVLVNGYLIGFPKGKIFTGSSKALCVPVLNCYSCPGALGACPVGSLQFALGNYEWLVVLPPQE